MFRGSLLVICNIVKHRLASAMKVNAWLCAFAMDRDLESTLSESINFRLPKTMNYVLSVSCVLCGACVCVVMCSVCVHGVCVSVCVWCWWRVHGGVVCSGKANDYLNRHALSDCTSLTPAVSPDAACCSSHAEIKADVDAQGFVAC